VRPFPYRIYVKKFKLAKDGTIIPRFKVVLFKDMFYPEYSRSWDIAVGIATGYRLDGRGDGVRGLVWQDFSLVPAVQTGSETHTASYPMDTGGDFSRGKAVAA
jgi:hypothetical protein